MKSRNVLFGGTSLTEQLKSFDNSIAYYKSQIFLSDDEKEKRDLRAKVDYLEKMRSYILNFPSVNEGVADNLILASLEKKK